MNVVVLLIAMVFSPRSAPERESKNLQWTWNFMQRWTMMTKRTAVQLSLHLSQWMLELQMLNDLTLSCGTGSRKRIFISRSSSWVRHVDMLLGLALSRSAAICGTCCLCGKLIGR